MKDNKCYCYSCEECQHFWAVLQMEGIERRCSLLEVPDSDYGTSMLKRETDFHRIKCPDCVIGKPDVAEQVVGRMREYPIKLPVLDACTTCSKHKFQGKGEAQECSVFGELNGWETDSYECACDYAEDTSC